MTRRILLEDDPVTSLADYAALGGGAGLEAAHAAGSAAVVDVIRSAGLRGRGGAGFPTAIKWSGLSKDDARRKFVVCNAAEGEPGTFKDRWLIRHNPYQVIEGIAIAAYATGAEQAYVGIKAKYTRELGALETAAHEMAAAGLVSVPIVFVPGPDDYLFGEEKALLEVVEGKDPLPRLYPPYIQGLHAAGDDHNPAVVNNVETLANVPHILRHGAEWFRSFGTEDTPGTMVFTISGDVVRHAVAELEMGTPLSFLVYTIGGGLPEGRTPKVVVSGVSNRPLSGAQLETPMDFGSMAAQGSGLGSGGYVVYDDSVCVAQVAAALSAFLFAGSCGQCPPCKLGTETITERFARLVIGGGARSDVEDIAAWTMRVTDSNRCGLGAGQRALAEGFLELFVADFAHHVDGEQCPGDRTVVAPVIDDYDETTERFTLVAPDPSAT